MADNINMSPIELALRQRIEQLEVKLAFYERDMRFKHLLPPFSELPPVELARSDTPGYIRLEKRAELSANVDTRGQVVVRVTGHSDDGVFGAQYVHSRVNLRRECTAELIADLHMRMLRQLAAFLIDSDDDVH